MDTFQKTKKELEKLATWYKTITLEKLKKKWESDLSGYAFLTLPELVLNSFIGFGKKSTCKVCKPVSGDCCNCIWSKLTFNYGTFGGICHCINHMTYKNLQNADTPRELKTACRARAKYIEKLLKKYDKKVKQ